MRAQPQPQPSTHQYECTALRAKKGEKKTLCSWEARSPVSIHPLSVLAKSRVGVIPWQ